MAYKEKTYKLGYTEFGWRQLLGHLEDYIISLEGEIASEKITKYRWSEDLIGANKTVIDNLKGHKDEIMEQLEKQGFTRRTEEHLS